MLNERSRALNLTCMGAVTIATLVHSGQSARVPFVREQTSWLHEYRPDHRGYEHSWKVGMLAPAPKATVSVIHYLYCFHDTEQYHHIPQSTSQSFWRRCVRLPITAHPRGGHATFIWSEDRAHCIAIRIGPVLIWRLGHAIKQLHAYCQ